MFDIKTKSGTLEEEEGKCGGVVEWWWREWWLCSGVFEEVDRCCLATKDNLAGSVHNFTTSCSNGG